MFFSFDVFKLVNCTSLFSFSLVIVFLEALTHLQHGHGKVLYPVLPTRSLVTTLQAHRCIKQGFQSFTDKKSRTLRAPVKNFPGPVRSKQTFK